MTIAHIFRPHFFWADTALLALAGSLAVAVSVSAGAQTIGNVPTIGNARPIMPQAGIPARIGAADPADMLSMHLRTLAVAPRSLSALLGAGESALAVGDPNAALGFYARAEQVDPRSGKAKAGLASALVMLERADDALPLFAQAVSLGIPEAEVASNRGLAYDLRGDSRRAQRDYQLALKHAPDDETTRRYALSLGISGDRAQAMTLLDPLLRKQDQSAWRARAFILAMTGDVAGANGIARQVMPANLASTMSPFLTRLPQLSAADKAHAVAFGTMPSSGTNMASVEIGDPFHAIRNNDAGGASDGLIPAGPPLGTDVPVARIAAVPLSREPRRRPGRDVVTMAAPAPVAASPARVAVGTDLAAERLSAPIVKAPVVIAQALPPRMVPKPGFSTPVPAIGQPVTGRAGAGVALASPVRQPPVIVKVPPTRTTNEGTVAETQSETKPVFETAPEPKNLPATDDNRPAFATSPLPVRASLTGPPAATPAPVSAPAHIVTPVPEVVEAPKPAAAVPMSRLASILAGLTPEMESTPVALPTAAEAKAARRVAQRKAAEAAAVAADLKAEKEAQAAEAAEAKRNPARLWVQVATGNNERGLPTTWNRIRDDNAIALKGRSAFSVPFKATNRLLVGPMKSPADARALVNTLAKNGLSANTFSSEAGQEVTRVGGK
ncbi:hypothetical protein BH09PSE3_BH09PSE3_25670 [soil metagenome]